DRLAGWQESAFAEVAENYRLRARRRLLAKKVQAHRFSVLHDDDVGRVAAFDDDVDLLHASDCRYPPGFAWREPEEPGDKAREGQSANRHDDLVRSHQRTHRGVQPRSRFAFV